MSKKRTPIFKRGDSVVWESQAGGYWQEKRGVVWAVVGPGEPPPSAPPTHIAMYGMYGWAGNPRDHESYIVEVRVGKTARAKPRLYWPRAASLRPAEDEG